MRVLIPIIIGLLAVGCGKKLITDPVVEKAIRKQLKKPEGVAEVRNLQQPHEVIIPPRA